MIIVGDIMKTKFIKSTIILIIGGGLSKLLGMLIKIITTRLIGEEGIGIYMLIMPTFSLFITLASLGLPVSISKLVSEDKHDNKRLVLSLIPLIIIFNFILMIIIFLITPTLSTYLLQDNRTFLPLISIGLVIPFISISSMLRGYFFGKEKMFPHTLSNLFEQIIRLAILLIITPYLLTYSIELAVMGIVLVNIVSEISSIIILTFFLPKNFKITKEHFKPRRSDVKEILDISVPTIGSRLLGSIAYFFEPIILTFVLLKVGYDSNYIITEYGILSGYVLPLLLIPSFFTSAISQALLPIISKAYSNKNFITTKKVIKKALLLSILIGLAINTALFVQPNFFLKLVFNTTKGSNYLKILTPFFLLLYVQSPLITVLHATNKARFSMIATFIGISIKLLTLFFLSYLKLGLYPLIIANILSILITTLLDIYMVNKILKTS